MSRALAHAERMLLEAAAVRFGETPEQPCARSKQRRLLLDAVLLADAGSSGHALAYLGAALATPEAYRNLPEALPREVASAVHVVLSSDSDDQNMPLREPAKIVLKQIEATHADDRQLGEAIRLIASELTSGRQAVCRVHVENVIPETAKRTR